MLYLVGSLTVYYTSEKLYTVWFRCLATYHELDEPVETMSACSMKPSEIHVLML